MSNPEKAALEKEYIRRFGGLEEIGPNELLFEAGYWDLLRLALERGTPLTPGEVRAAFPDAAWEY